MTYDYDFTIFETIGEDANGAAIERVTEWPGAFQAMTLSERRNADGPVSADSCYLVITHPDALAGFRTSWDLPTGAKITIRGRKTTVNDRDVSVLSVIAAENPRTGILHHIEVSAG